jgi:hypothetical protein
MVDLSVKTGGHQTRLKKICCGGKKQSMRLYGAERAIQFLKMIVPLLTLIDFVEGPENQDYANDPSAPA